MSSLLCIFLSLCNLAKEKRKKNINSSQFSNWKWRERGKKAGDTLLKKKNQNFKRNQCLDSAASEGLHYEKTGENRYCTESLIIGHRLDFKYEATPERGLWLRAHVLLLILFCHSAHRSPSTLAAPVVRQSSKPSPWDASRLNQ